MTSLQAMDPYRPAATPESIAKAKADCEAERAKIRAAGVPVDNEGHLQIPELRPLHMALIEDCGIPLSIRTACSEKVSALVEEYGLDCLIRSVRCELAVNGMTLTVAGKDRP